MDAAQRLEFAPPPGAGLSRALLLALLAHVLLVTALTWGVRWKRDAAQVTAEAELWSSVPLAAAPRLVETPPAPAAEPPAPQPVTLPVTQPVAPPLASKADIALEREKQRQKTERQQAALKLEQQRRQQAALDKKKKAEQSTKVADAAKSKQEAEQAKQEAAKLETQRQLNMQRMAGMAGLAGASGAPSATGSARQSAAPSAGYAARVVASIKPNVVFTEEPVGNPSVDIELRAAADGTIVSSKVIKSSGNKAWDDAVQKGIDKTAVLPRDLDGRVPSPMVIAYRFR